jgi:hypothetical protein
MTGPSTPKQKQLSELTISEKLFQMLSEIDRTGTFCSQGSLSPVLPGLDISGIGPIAFPLTPGQAEQIKQQCEQAPYGKGKQTLLDTSVRQVWRMTPDRFQLANPEWQEFVVRVVSTVQQDLGLEGQELKSHLYDLLLYEKGSFFLPHRDGEKLDRMVATLVIVLPSAFQGGELIVRHEGQEQIVDFGSLKNSHFKTHFAAFYADCEHEVLPLADGYRLCLVYNLTLATSKKSISAPRNQAHIDSIASLLRNWATDSTNDWPFKFAIPLEHQYTQDGLSWDTLKGVDRTRTQVIRHAARQANCKVHLAQLTFWEQGSAEYYGEPSSERWYNQNNDSPDTYEMEEVFDSSLTAEHWIDDEGNHLNLAPMPVLEEEVVPQEALKEVAPEEEFEGYTGNAGMTLERWYRHCAIFLWPEKHHFQILCDCGSDSAVTVLNLLVRKWQNADSSKKTELKAQCLELATKIINQWNPVPYFEPEDGPKPSEIIPILKSLDNSKLIKAFLSEVLPKDASLESNPALLRLCEKHGWSMFQQEFESIFKSTTLRSLGRNVRLLEQLCSQELHQNPERRKLCAGLAQQLVSALATIDKEKDDWRAAELKRAPVLVGMVKALISAEQFETLAKLTAYTLSTPRKYSLTPVLVETLLDLQDWLPKHVKQQCAINEWLDACQKNLKSLTKQLPEEPDNFCREAIISCRCADCQELILFLKNPTEKAHGFRIRKDRRQHLHQIIEKHECDVDHVTERIGSPQLLVCTKNINSFKRNLQKYETNKKRLAALQSLEASLLRQLKPNIQSRSK